MDNRIAGASKGVKDQSNVVMERGIPIVQGDRLADQVQSDIVAARLVGENAKKMEAVDVILIDRENFSVLALCLGKPASLMMNQRRGQLIGNPSRGVSAWARWRRGGDSRRMPGCRLSLFSLHGMPRCKPSPNVTAGLT